jgi:hypothetical protein
MPKGASLLASFLLVGLLSVSCTEVGPEKPFVNTPPETQITGISIGDVTTIYFAGRDDDGTIDGYQWSLDGAPWSEVTSSTQLDTAMSYADLDDLHTFRVRAIDDDAAWDETPAEVSFGPSESGVYTAAPETQITGGPPSGEMTGDALLFSWTGTDIDGAVSGYLHTLDQTSAWTDVDASVTSHLYVGLSDGPHTFYVKARDDVGMEDASPAQVSFVVKGDYFAPQLQQTAGPASRGGWFVGADLPFGWAANADHYYGVIDGYSYALDSAILNNDPLSPDYGAYSSGWVDETTVIYPAAVITAGYHSFYFSARDAGGAITRAVAESLSVVVFNPSLGILEMDDLDWVPGDYVDDADMDAQITAGFFGGADGVAWPKTHWDVSSDGLPTPDELAQYSSVVLYTDGGYPSAALGLTFAGYAQAGGNFMVMGYALDAFDSFMFQTLHVYNASVYSGGGWIGMSGQAGTAYEGLNIPVIPAYAGAGRSYHRVYSGDDECEEIFAQVNVDPGETRNCMVIWRNPDKGNAGVVVGQSMPFLDQTVDDVKTLGDMILGDEFGESK